MKSLTIGQRVWLNENKKSGYVCSSVGIDGRSPKKFRVQWDNCSQSLHLASEVTPIN